MTLSPVIALWLVLPTSGNPFNGLGFGSASAGAGTGKIFEVFAATVIGGVSMNGGRGSLFGALTGALTLKLIENVLTDGHVSAQDIEFFNGVVILVALIVSRYTSGAAQD